MTEAHDGFHYATEQTDRLVRSLATINPACDPQCLITNYLLRAYDAGYRSGLERGYKTTWKVVKKYTRYPDESEVLFEGGLSYEVALQVMKTANRVHPNMDYRFDLEPEEKS
jgi:hypothetical protein